MNSTPSGLTRVWVDELEESIGEEIDDESGYAIKQYLQAIASTALELDDPAVTNNIIRPLCLHATGSRSYR